MAETVVDPYESQRGFPLMNLPAELRIEIYRYSLVSGIHCVPRGRLSALHSLRYRHTKQATLLRERVGTDCAILCKDYECRQRLAQHEHAIEPIQANEFAFGLFRTGKEVSREAFGVFFGQTHFVFESRLDLHMFLRANKHAYLVKSLTFNARKSHGPHSKQLKARFTTWKLRSECFWGPSVLHSLRELGRLCPKLAYMEMIDERQCDSVQVALDLGTRGYVEWKEMQYIRTMGLKDFSYLLPDQERYRDVAAKGLLTRHLSTSFFDWPLQQQNRLREMAEAYIRSGIAAAQSR
jgi:hypothetical protein